MCCLAEATLVVPFLVPLPLSILPFYRHCQRGYYEASIRLSLLAARRIDEELERTTGRQAEKEGSPATETGASSTEGKKGEEEEPLRSSPAKAIVDYFELR